MTRLLLCCLLPLVLQFYVTGFVEACTEIHSRFHSVPCPTAGNTENSREERDLVNEEKRDSWIQKSSSIHNTDQSNSQKSSHAPVAKVLPSGSQISSKSYQEGHWYRNGANVFEKIYQKKGSHVSLSREINGGPESKVIVLNGAYVDQSNDVADKTNLDSFILYIHNPTIVSLNTPTG